ncbi:MAG: hypothetical protein GYB65_17675 [Chloroflexi bacterium]|nr:hypothetical protein [Chloroflexota bacterium]
MDTPSDLLSAPKEFLSLFKAGKAAAQRGDRTQAHDLFRQAIEVDPYHEQVWLWLASVVETDADRRVCFENVLELNSANPIARRQLQRLDQQAVASVLADNTHQKRPIRRWLVGLALVVVLVTVVGGTIWVFF